MQFADQINACHIMRPVAHSARFQDICRRSSGVEHVIGNDGVGGSIPPDGTIFLIKLNNKPVNQSACQKQQQCADGSFYVDGISIQKLCYCRA